jgi:hypothetical protein
LIELFPSLTKANFTPTSPETGVYNCIAWAYGRNDVWCQPDGGYFWPISRKDGSIDAYVELFSSVGYRLCADASMEAGFLKIALYVKHGQITHAARQLTTGRWTSKLGQSVDIEHDCPEVLNGPAYGGASILMKRALEAQA